MHISIYRSLSVSLWWLSLIDGDLYLYIYISIDINEFSVPYTYINALQIIVAQFQFFTDSLVPLLPFMWCYVSELLSSVLSCCATLVTTLAHMLSCSFFLVFLSYFCPHPSLNLHLPASAPPFPLLLHFPWHTSPSLTKQPPLFSLHCLCLWQSSVLHPSIHHSVCGHEMWKYEDPRDIREWRWHIERGGRRKHIQ